MNKKFIVRIKNNWHENYAKRSIMPYELAYQLELCRQAGGVVDTDIKTMGKGELALALSNAIMLWNAAKEVTRFNIGVDMVESVYSGTVNGENVMIFEYEYIFD